MQADTCRQPRPIRFVRPGRVGWATTSIAVGLLWQILLLLLFWLLPATFFKGAGHTHSGAGCRNGWTPRLSWFKWCRREVRSPLHKPTDQYRSPLPGKSCPLIGLCLFQTPHFPDSSSNTGSNTGKIRSLTREDSLPCRDRAASVLSVKQKIEKIRLCEDGARKGAILFRRD